MAWCEIIHEYFSLLLEHNSLTWHVNVINTFTLAFCTIHVTIHFSQTWHSSLLMAPKTCKLTGDLTVVWIHFAWYFSIYLRQTRLWRRLLWLSNTDSCECIVFPQKGYIFMHDIAPCHNSKRHYRTFLECNGIPVLKWPANSPKNEFHSDCLEYNEERDW